MITQSAIRVAQVSRAIVVHQLISQFRIPGLQTEGVGV